MKWCVLNVPIYKKKYKGWILLRASIFLISSKRQLKLCLSITLKEMIVLEMTIPCHLNSSF